MRQLSQRKDAATSVIRQQARTLRQALTDAEQRLWQRLRDRRLAGLKFRRQHPVGSFIVDFYCAQYRLIVEVDGPIHQQQQEHDQLRAQELTRRGYRVMRFTNQQVLDHLEALCTEIVRICHEI